MTLTYSARGDFMFMVVFVVVVFVFWGGCCASLHPVKSGIELSKQELGMIKNIF